MTDLNPDWINAFADVFSRCAIKRDEKLVIFSETSSSAQLIEIARQAFGQLSLSPTMIVVQTPSEPQGPIVKSSGASKALTGQAIAISALKSADVIIDLSVEGLMHTKETPEILQSGARIMNISHEHPECLPVSFHLMKIKIKSKKLYQITHNQANDCFITSWK